MPLLKWSIASDAALVRDIDRHDIRELRRGPVITMRKTEIRAAEYRSNADAALVRARASVLQHERDRHELSASTWSQLAEIEERRGAQLSQVLGRGGANDALQPI